MEKEASKKGWRRKENIMSKKGERRVKVRIVGCCLGKGRMTVARRGERHWGFTMSGVRRVRKRRKKGEKANWKNEEALSGI